MPAKAPSSARVERTHAKQAKADQGGDVTTKLTWKGREYRLSQSDLGPGDDAKCRAQTAAYTGGPGWTLTGLMQTAAAAAAKGGDMATAGMDVLAVLLWMVLVKNGQPELKLAEVFDSLSAADLVEGFGVEVEVQEGEARPPGA